jgi:hypothetical protein
VARVTVAFGSSPIHVEEELVVTNNIHRVRATIVAARARSWLKGLRRGPRVAIALMTVVLGMSGSVVFAKSGWAAAPTGTWRVAVNTANWSRDAGYGSSFPWLTTGNQGVVQLEGAARQVSSAGGDPNLLGWVNRYWAPDRDVYTIAHSLGGTYVDLVINTSGEIRVIAPRWPAATDLGFVSLEGITYSPNSQTEPVPSGTVGVNVANWSLFAGWGSAMPGWYKDSQGLVHLQGAAKQVTSSGGDPNLLGTLPPAIRPACDVYTIVHTMNGTYADLVINTNGEIRVTASRWPAVTDYSFVSLEGITYYPWSWEVVNWVNAPNWSQDAGYNACQAGWIQDSSGTVHLMGAAKQVTSSAGDPNLLGTLDPSARPGRDVYTIAHSLNGTCVDLVINTNGEIRVIASRWPAVTDYGFVSLESISYHK